MGLADELVHASFRRSGYEPRIRNPALLNDQDTELKRNAEICATDSTPKKSCESTQIPNTTFAVHAIEAQTSLGSQQTNTINAHVIEAQTSLVSQQTNS